MQFYAHSFCRASRDIFTHMSQHFMEFHDRVYLLFVDFFDFPFPIQQFYDSYAKNKTFATLDLVIKSIRQIFLLDGQIVRASFKGASVSELCREAKQVHI